MEKDKLIVKTNSTDLWWGIYGFCEKTGWEDLTILNSQHEKVGSFCLNTKRYLRNGLESLRNDPYEQDFVKAIDSYLLEDRIHYWFYYGDPSNEELYEVPYNAPRNDQGNKPEFLDIWHPDEAIEIRTIESAARNFGETFLGMTDIEIQIEKGPDIEESWNAYKEHQKLFGADRQVQIDFTEELVKELSALWNRSEEETIQLLKKSL